MAGIKARKGQQVHHVKYYVGGREVRPCLVYQRKILSNGYKKLKSANYIDTGETSKIKESLS